MGTDAVLHRASLLEKLAGLVLATGGPHPTRVAIDGPDAAGKTTLADELAGVLQPHGREVIRASIDGFHHPRVRRHERGRESPLGYYVDSFDLDALRSRVLDPLGPGGDLCYTAAWFDYRADRPLEVAAQTASTDAILLCDGVFLLRPELRDAWDVTIFVSIGWDEVLRRARVRDAAAFGSVEEVERLYHARYIPGQQLYFAEAQPEEEADAVVVNDDPASPRLRLR